MSISILKRSLEIVDEDETKKKQKKKFQNQRRANLFDFDDKNVKRKTIVEVKKEILAKSDRADRNVEKLLKLSKTNVESSAAKKLLQRARTGKYVLKTEESEEVEAPSNQDSIFTDEDFANFEKEFIADS